LWLQFNREGAGPGLPYDPLVATVDKFDLFAGWLLGSPAAGVAGRSTDKDLNGFRSAINRHISDARGERPLRGNPEFSRTIKMYRELMVASKPDADLHRVPTPEPVFLYLVSCGESPLTSDADLVWIGTFVLQLFGWLRADSVAGFTPGDIVLSPAGWLVIAVRKMKHRSEFSVQPGMISIPPAPAGHPRARLLSVLRRCFRQLPASWYCSLARCDLSAVSVRTGESASAQFLTLQLRRLVRPMAHEIPAGVVLGSHSWREMGAVASFHAKYDTLRMACHGFWKDPGTMWNSYIKPYKDTFPFCRFLAATFDFLRAV
jgi:hypothetical protein